MDLDYDSITSGPTLYKAILLYRDTNYFPNAHLACAFDTSQGELVNGKFLTDRDVKSLFTALYEDLSSDVNLNEESSYDLNDPRVLGSGSSFLCFEIPKHKRTLFFGENLPKIGLEEVPLPRLIAILSDKGSHLVAVKAMGAITTNTPLYHAPIPENDTSGRIHDCGLRWPKNRFSTTNVEANINAILNSQKLNIRHNKLCKGDYEAVIGEARKQGNFPSSALVPMKMRLADLLSSIAGEL